MSNDKDGMVGTMAGSENGKRLWVPPVLTLEDTRYTAVGKISNPLETAMFNEGHTS